MKLAVLSLLLLVGLHISYSQHFDEVDVKARQYPAQYKSPERLATQIIKDFKLPEDRVRALYVWLTNNVQYDLQSYYSGQTSVGISYTSQDDLKRKLEAINTNIIINTLRSKKAVCEGFAQTFRKVSELMGIPCKVIGGYSKGDVRDIGLNPKQENHAWNAVKINQKWYLVDSTWGAGYVNGKKWVQRFNDFYFFTDPDQFALTHYPSEKEWLFINKIFTKKQFYESPVYEKAFFKNNLKLLSPIQGRLEVNSNSSIEFVMTNIPKNVTLYYAFKGNRYSKRIEPNCINGKCTFKIPFNQNRNSELVIFANKNTALQYKISLRD